MNAGSRLRCRLPALCLATLAFSAVAAHAGRNCEAQAPMTWKVERGMALAERTQQALDATGAQVVVLTRAGQDLSKYRLHWSHLGFAYRQAAQTTQASQASQASSPTAAAEPAVWRVVHKLNHCAAATSDVYRQGLGEFFLDDPYEFAAAIVVLTPEVQARLLPLLQDNARMTALHEPAYNMLAYPWSQLYQQSNQWAIETLALAVEPSADTRERAQAWLRFKGYEPTVLRLSPLVRLGARMTAANIAFDDHPNDKRYSDRIETVTADSVMDWLQRSGLAASVQTVR